MRFRHAEFIVLATVLPLLASIAAAAPPSREVYERQSQVLEHLATSVAAQDVASDKFALINGVLSAEADSDFRRRVLQLAADIPGPEREAFFLQALLAEPDAGLRSQAAEILGRTGFEKSLAPLATAAASDRTTDLRIGCIGGRGTARRTATFALAELATRLPKLADDAAAKLTALPDTDDPRDNESLGDARRQALYQITHEAALLEPFLKRLASDDPKQRERGLVAFRFLKLTKAPPEIVAALADADPGVRSWAILVLGEIGDAATAEPLLTIAADGKRTDADRTSAISALGTMRAPAAADLMEKLLDEPTLGASAAIALYRITGKRAPQFPAGYNAD